MTVVVVVVVVLYRQVLLHVVINSSSSFFRFRFVNRVCVCVSVEGKSQRGKGWVNQTIGWLFMVSFFLVSFDFIILLLLVVVAY